MIEPIILYASAYLSYLLAELFEFSGIVAIICCGLIQGHYAMDNISSKSYVATRYCTKVASSLVESIIFIILGVMMVNGEKGDATGDNNESVWASWDTAFCIFALFLVVASRFIGAFDADFMHKPDDLQSSTR